MTVEELRAEADKLGYYITKKQPQKATAYRKCGECKYLTGKHSSIGIVCENPAKTWRSWTAQYKYRHTPSCKLFTEKDQGETNGKENK